MPLIRGVNDDAENLQKTADFCSGLKNVSAMEFLPYHRLGIHAYEQLFRPYALQEEPRMDREEARDKVAFLAEQDLPFCLILDGEVLSRPSQKKAEQTGRGQRSAGTVRQGERT